MPVSLGSARRFLLLALVAALASSSAGCVRNQVSIVMTPRGATLERRLTIQRDLSRGDSLPHGRAPDLEAAESERLARVYRVRPDARTHRPYVAVGRFRGVPEDVGNGGVFRRSTSPLGSTWVYAERLRGFADAGEFVRARFETADSLVDLFGGWLRSELGDRPGYGRLATFVDRDLRRQMHHLAALATMPGASEDSVGTGWMGIELEQHATLWCLAALAMPDVSEPTPTEAVGRLRRELAGIMGIRSPAEAASAFAFLADPPTATRSLRRFIERSAGVSGEEAEGYVEAIVGRMLMYDPAPPDEFQIDLVLPVEPDPSNGAWDRTAHRVRWRASLPAPASNAMHAPFVCYARWSVPDSVLQRRLFAAVLVTGEDLARYDAWYELLDRPQRLAWDRMLLALRPGRLGALERFRFAGEEPNPPAPGDSVAWSLADQPRRLILDAERARQARLRAPRTGR